MLTRTLAYRAKRRATYWPPSDTSRHIKLPDGRKKLFVFNAKSDRDGSLQPVLCVQSRGGERLAIFDEEEVDELIRVCARMDEYMGIWEKKAEMNKIKAAEMERRRLAAEENIGVEL